METSQIVLVGLMGSGKTTVGRALADRLGWPFVDSDADLAARGGRTARQIADDAGLDALHGQEAAALLAALARPGPSVVAAASSTIEDAACRAALTGDELFVAWLRADPGTLAGRVGDVSHRPRLLTSEVALTRQAAVREPLFAQVADVEVETDTRAPGATVDAIVAALADTRPA